MTSTLTTSDPSSPDGITIATTSVLQGENGTVQTNGFDLASANTTGTATSKVIYANSKYGTFQK